MIKHYFLAICCLMGWASRAQTIVFADSDFKELLMQPGTCFDNNNEPMNIDASGDNEIQVSEAAAVYILYIGDGNGVSDLGGIENFTNIWEFSWYYGDPMLNTINLSMLPNLWHVMIYSTAVANFSYNPAIRAISIQHSQLTSFDTAPLAGNANFSLLNLADNQLVNVNLSGLQTCPLMGSLILKNNSLGSIDWSPLAGNTSITEIDLSNNAITAFDFAQVNDAVTRINLSSNLLASVDFTPLNHDLEALHVENNPYAYFDTAGLAQVDTLMAGSESLHDAKFTVYNFDYVGLLGHNINSIDMKNGHNEACFSISILCPFGPQFGAFKNPNQIFCVDDFPNFIDEGDGLIRDHSEQNYWNWMINGEPAAGPSDPLLGPHITSYCSYTPGGNYNTISGNLTSDCGNANIAVPLSPVHFTNSSGTDSTVTDQQGEYYYYTANQDVVVAPQLEFPAYFTVTPAIYTYHFTSFGNNETANFCITPNGIHHNLELSLYSNIAARPGFDATYSLVYRNNGNQIDSGTVALNFDDAILNYVSANPTVNSQIPGNLVWNFTNLAPFESRTIQFTLHANGPMETPAVNNGDILHFNAAITSAGTDEVLADNHAYLNQVVIGSLDPNDKQVSEGSHVAIAQSGDYLHYNVRFQNTGTASAENVVIKDLLESDLDFNSVQIISASHPYRATLTNQNQLEIFFEGINLPTSTDNEPASHGYVAFKIKPKNTVAVGTEIKNSAGIYFDYNFPVMTNTTTTTFSVLETQQFVENHSITIYPNPAKSVIYIDGGNAGTIKSISIYNLLGQLMATASNPESLKIMTADVSNLETGNYFIRVETQNSITTQHFIKR